LSIQRLLALLAIIAGIIIFIVNAYWATQYSGLEGCYVQERFVIPDACVGDCEEGEICRVVETREYAFGFLEQPYNCVCVRRGKRPGSMGETGAGATGIVVSPSM
jgi:hypothetical protein